MVLEGSLNPFQKERGDTTHDREEGKTKEEKKKREEKKRGKKE